MAFCASEFSSNIFLELPSSFLIENEISAFDIVKCNGIYFKARPSEHVTVPKFLQEEFRSPFSVEIIRNCKECLCILISDPKELSLTSTLQVTNCNAFPFPSFVTKNTKVFDLKKPFVFNSILHDFKRNYPLQNWARIESQEKVVSFLASKIEEYLQSPVKKGYKFSLNGPFACGKTFVVKRVFSQFNLPIYHFHEDCPKLSVEFPCLVYSENISIEDDVFVIYEDSDFGGEIQLQMPSNSEMNEIVSELHLPEMNFNSYSLADLEKFKELLLEEVFNDFNGLGISQGKSVPLDLQDFTEDSGDSLEEHVVNANDNGKKNNTDEINNLIEPKKHKE